MGKLEAQYSRMIGEPRVGYLHGQATPDMFGAGTGRALRGLGDALGDLGRLYAGFLNDGSDKIASNYAARCKAEMESYVNPDGTYDLDKIAGWDARKQELLQKEIDENGGNYNRKRLQMYVEKTDLLNDSHLQQIYHRQLFNNKLTDLQDLKDTRSGEYISTPNEMTRETYRASLVKLAEMQFGGNAVRAKLEELRKGLENGEITLGGQKLKVIDDETDDQENNRKVTEEYKKDPKGKRLKSQLRRLFEDKETTVRKQDAFIQANMDQADFKAFSEKLKRNEFDEAQKIMNFPGIGDAMKTQMQKQFDSQHEIFLGAEEGRNDFDSILMRRDGWGDEDNTEWKGSDNGNYMTPEIVQAIHEYELAIDTTTPRGQARLRAFQDASRKWMQAAHAREQADYAQFSEELLATPDSNTRARYIEEKKASGDTVVTDRLHKLNTQIEANNARAARKRQLDNKPNKTATDKAALELLKIEKDKMEMQAIYDYAVNIRLASTRDELSTMSEEQLFNACCVKSGITDKEQQKYLWNRISQPQGKYEVTMAKMLVSEINGNFTGGGKTGNTLQVTSEEILKVMPELINLGMSFTGYTEWTAEKAKLVKGNDEDLLKNAIRRMMTDIKVPEKPGSKDRIPLGQWIAKNRDTWKDMDDTSIARGRMLFEKALADWHAGGNDAVYREIIKQILDNKRGENGVKPSFME